MSLLEGEPGKEYVVRNERPEQDVDTERATADEDGVLRDEEGRSYSAGAYTVLKPAYFDGEHVVTAVEPAWVRQEHQPDDEGHPEPVTENETVDLIDDMYEDSTYECTCGVEMDDWSEVEVHFKAISQ